MEEVHGFTSPYSPNGCHQVINFGTHKHKGVVACEFAVLLLKLSSNHPKWTLYSAYWSNNLCLFLTCHNWSSRAHAFFQAITYFHKKKMNKVLCCKEAWSKSICWWVSLAVQSLLTSGQNTTHCHSSQTQIWMILKMQHQPCMVDSHSLLGKHGVYILHDESTT